MHSTPILGEHTSAKADGGDVDEDLVGDEKQPHRQRRRMRPLRLDLTGPILPVVDPGGPLFSAVPSATAAARSQPAPSFQNVVPPPINVAIEAARQVERGGHDELTCPNMDAAPSPGLGAGLATDGLHDFNSLIRMLESGIAGLAAKFDNVSHAFHQQAVETRFATLETRLEAVEKREHIRKVVQDILWDHVPRG